MASLTKDQLRNELVNHGVSLPPSSYKKDELMKLYEQHVAPSQDAAGEFSSDDEIHEQVLNGDQVSNTGTDVSELSNDELSSKLKMFGVDVGPIVGSTRRLYERKLEKLLGAGSRPVVRDIPRETNITNRTTSSRVVTSVTVTNGSGPDADEFSDSESEELAPAPQLRPSPRKQPAPGGASGRTASSRTTTEYSSEIRRRAVGDGLYGYSYVSPRASAPMDVDTAQLDPRSPALRPVFLKDDSDQPSPRRSVRDVRGSYPLEQYVYSSQLGSGAYGTADYPDAYYDKQLSAGERRWVRSLVKLAILLLLIAAGYYCYQNGDSSTIRSVKEAAMEAIEKVSAKVEDLRRNDDAPPPPPGAATDA